MELRQAECNVMLDTDLSRFHQIQVIYLTGKDHKLWPTITYNFSVSRYQNKITCFNSNYEGCDNFMISDHSRKQNRCFQEAETPWKLIVQS